MKLPIEAVIVLLKNTKRRVFDEKLVWGILAVDHEIIFFGKFYFGSNFGGELPFGLAVFSADFILAVNRSRA